MATENICEGPWCPVFNNIPCLKGESIAFELEPEDYIDFDRVIAVIEDMAENARLHDL